MNPLPIILDKGRADAGKAIRFLSQLPTDKAWEVVVRPYRAKRSDEQNRYWWGVVVKTFAETVGYEMEEVHQFLCGSHFGWKDRRVPRTPRNPEGLDSVPLRTTTRDESGHHAVLNKQDFGDLIAFAQRFGAQRGIFIPDPNPEWFMKDEEKAA